MGEDVIFFNIVLDSWLRLRKLARNYFICGTTIIIKDTSLEHSLPEKELESVYLCTFYPSTQASRGYLISLVCVCTKE